MARLACHARGVFSWFRRRRLSREWSQISARVEAAGVVRREALLGQEADVEWLEALLFAVDPIGINFESNTDEYRPEAETITLRRSEASSLDDVRRIVYEELMSWFGQAGPPDLCERIANEIWRRWNSTDRTGQ